MKKVSLSDNSLKTTAFVIVGVFRFGFSRVILIDFDAFFVFFLLNILLPDLIIE